MFGTSSCKVINDKSGNLTTLAHARCVSQEETSTLTTRQYVLMTLALKGIWILNLHGCWALGKHRNIYLHFLSYLDIWVCAGGWNPSSGGGLLPDGTKALPEPILTYHQRGLAAFDWGQFHTKFSRYLSLIWVSKLLIYDYRCIFQALGQLANSLRPSDAYVHW